MQEIDIDKEFLGVVELPPVPESEELTMTFSIEELTVLHQVMGFVTPDNSYVKSLINKLSSRTDEELVEELFTKVYISVDSDLPLFKQDLSMQENCIEIKLIK